MVHFGFIFGVRYERFGYKTMDTVILTRNLDIQIPTSFLATVGPFSRMHPALGQIHAPIFTD